MALQKEHSDSTKSSKQDAVCVAMLHGGRSGSTVLGDLLNQHDSIFWDSEIYQNARMRPLPNTIIKQLKRFPRALISARRFRTQRPIYGFETKFQHLYAVGMDLSSYVQALETINFSHFVILERKNYLRRITSHLVAYNNKTWHQKKKGKVTQIHVNLERLKIGWRQVSLLEHLNIIEQEIEDALKILSNRNVLHLTYEDDISGNPQIAFNKMCDFIGLEKPEVNVSYRKTNPYHLSTIITNFDEVKEALEPTKFAWMLD
ncbi:MAG: hypothetical protein AAF490_26355 [Chloroflexota bacterium]